MVLSPAERRSLLLARMGLLMGFALMLVLSVLWIIYIVILIFTSGDPQRVEGLFNTVGSLVYSLDLVAVGLLALGFWQFGARHDTLGGPTQNMAMGFGLWGLVTLIWRLKLIWTPRDEVNPVSTRFQGGEFDLFIPHFEFLKDNYVGFFVSALLMFFLMTMLVRLIRNYRVWENFQTVNLNLFRAYGLFYLIGAILMGLGWLGFSPANSGSTLGIVLLVVFVVGWLTVFLGLPILGLWVFYPAFTIHRSAVDTLQFILRRKAERESYMAGSDETHGP